MLGNEPKAKAFFLYILRNVPNVIIIMLTLFNWSKNQVSLLCISVIENVKRFSSPNRTWGQSYKQFTLVIYDSRDVIWDIFKSGTTLEL